MQFGRGAHIAGLSVEWMFSDLTAGLLAVADGTLMVNGVCCDCYFPMRTVLTVV